MSLGPENFPDLLNDLPGAPKMCRNLSTPTCPRLNTHHLRDLKTALQRHDSFSPHNDSKLFEKLSSGLPVRNSRLSQSIRQPKSNFLVSYQPRDQLKAQFLEKKAMILEKDFVEPESSTSRPSEINSPFDRIYSPNLTLERIASATSSAGDLFGTELYTRIEEFLDEEGLTLSCPDEEIKGIRCFSKLFMASCNASDDQSETHSVQSDHASLISDNIVSSSLFQRRASRSQGPEEIGSSRESSLTKKRPAKLCVFRHFDEHINHCLQMTSPIEEKVTPILTNETFNFLEKENIPPNLPVLKKYCSKGLGSPVLNYKDTKGILLPPLPCLKQSKSFFSPNIGKPKQKNQGKKLRSSRPSGAFSVCSSPTEKKPFKDSPRTSLHKPSNNGVYNLNSSLKSSKFRNPKDLFD